MVLFPIKALEELNIPTTVVLGYQADLVKEKIEQAAVKSKTLHQNISYVLQEERLGTGHAVACTKDLWDKDNILIVNADIPLLTSQFFEMLFQKHQKNDATLTFVSTILANPTGYGRIIETNNHVQICEEKNCDEKLKEINKVNAGIYIIKRSFLESYLTKVTKDNVSGEFYLTDLVAFASRQKLPINIIPAPFDQVRGVNTLQELWAVEQVLRSKLIKHWMANGVRFELAQSIHLDLEVEIGPDSFVGTGAHILGKTKIGEGCFIAAFSILENTVVGDDTNIHSHSVIQDSVIGKNVHVGPFARLRNNVILGDNVNIGNFVEMKNTTADVNTKIKHLSYVGDAEIGKSVNIGAGTIFCNYDGFQKHKTIIEENVFIGSNDTIIAPVTIKKDSYVAAGSTITKDVETDDLAIGRARQENKKGYAQKIRNHKAKLSDKQKDQNKKIKLTGVVKSNPEAQTSQ